VAAVSEIAKLYARLVPEFEFIVVPVAQLDDWWDHVRDAIQSVREKTGARWSTELVYHWVASQRASLNITRHDGEIIGVSVVCQDGDAMARPHDGLILLAWSDPKNQQRGFAEAEIRFTEAQIVDRLRQSGFKKVTWFSPRRGWLGKKSRPGLALRLGYELRGYIFAKEI
jgi:hypothetical protein